MAMLLDLGKTTQPILSMRYVDHCEMQVFNNFAFKLLFS
jgi:hypothetical protein